MAIIGKLLNGFKFVSLLVFKDQMVLVEHIVCVFIPINWEKRNYSASLIDCAAALTQHEICVCLNLFKNLCFLSTLWCLFEDVASKRFAIDLTISFHHSHLTKTLFIVIWSSICTLVFLPNVGKYLLLFYLVFRNSVEHHWIRFGSSVVFEKFDVSGTCFGSWLHKRTIWCEKWVLCDWAKFVVFTLNLSRERIDGCLFDVVNGFVINKTY